MLLLTLFLNVQLLIAFHAYEPKFTEFKMSEPRVGSKENEAHERNMFGNVTEILKFEANDLKIAVTMVIWPM